MISPENLETRGDRRSDKGKFLLAAPPRSLGRIPNKNMAFLFGTEHPVAAVAGYQLRGQQGGFQLRGGNTR